MPTRFSAHLSAFWRRIDKKTACLVVLALILLLLGDTLLPLIGHLLHVIIEVVESVLEHFLESVFGLSSRQAQIILFYSGLAIAINLLWRLTRKAYLSVLRVYGIVKAYVLAKTSDSKTDSWFRAMVMIGTLGATLYLFT